MPPIDPHPDPADTVPHVGQLVTGIAHDLHESLSSIAGLRPMVPVALRPMKVLVIDKEPRLARVGAVVLAKDGHLVRTAHSGEEAMAQLDRLPVDVVFSAVNLGSGMNGWVLAKLVKKRWPTTRFVLLTGRSASADAVSDEVDAVIVMPYRLATLRQSLQQSVSTPLPKDRADNPSDDGREL